MPKLIKIRVPMIVTADGKWAVHGASSYDPKIDTDWRWLDEMCDHDTPTINPRRFWIETAVEVSDEETVVTGATIPEKISD